ncbi:MAG: TonB-dependent receptor [Gammaproteobacteria bacterium]|nr:TonB-dependent receptor [Gammaproteobacteria bacterium]
MKRLNVVAGSARRVITATCAGLVMVLSLPAATADTGTIEEIVVTARKREERLQDTPISITAFTARDLELRPESNIGELVNFAPNVSYTIGGANGGSASQIFIRGIGQVDFAIGQEPGVATYVDGVYLSRTVGALLDIVDFERIEVLRGPQGTLFGRNAVGGALNITTVKPGDTFAAGGEVTVGRFDRLDGKGMINVPLSDTLSLRLTAAHRGRDGIGERLTDGEDVGDIDTDAGRAQLRWALSDALEVNFAADYMRKDEGTYPATLLTVESPPVGLAALYSATVGAAAGIPFTPALITGDRYDSYTGGPNVNDQTIWGLSMTVDAALAGLDLRSITAYRELDARYSRETDGYPLPLLDVINDDAQQQLSQELQLSQSRDRLDWIAGFFYFNENSGGVSDSMIGSGIYPFLEALPGPFIPLGPPPPGTSCAAGTTPPGFPCAGGAGNPINIALDNDRTDIINQDTRSYALFGEATYDLSELLSLTLGGRYTIEDKEFTLDSTRTQSGVTLLPYTKVEESWTNFSPKGGIDVHWREDLLTYFTVTKGFKAGGFNARARNGTELEPFDPEEVLTYELGLKSQWFDNRLRANAAVFYNDYTDIQVIVVQADPTTGQVFSRVENAGEAEIKGFELELTARVAEGLDLAGGVGYTDAEFTEVQTGGEFTEDSEFIQTPKWTANVSLQYARSLAAYGQLIVRADYAHRSEYYNDAQNSERTRESGYGLLNASITWQTADEHMGLRLFGTNLTDAEYLMFGIDPTAGLGFSSGTFGRPREWGLTAFYRF